MDEFDPKDGDYLGRISMPMANIAWLIADVRTKLNTLHSDDLDEMLGAIQVRVEYLQSLAVRMDQVCQNCVHTQSNSTLESTVDQLFDQPSAPGKNDS